MYGSLQPLSNSTMSRISIGVGRGRRGCRQKKGGWQQVNLVFVVFMSLASVELLWGGCKILGVVIILEALIVMMGEEIWLLRLGIYHS
jgi:hypothetical protein